MEDAFLTEYPWRTEVVNKVPWIAGVTSGEGFMLAKSKCVGCTFAVTFYRNRVICKSMGEKCMYLV